MGAARLAIDDRLPWRVLHRGDVTLAYSGYVFRPSVESLVRAIASLSTSATIEDVASVVVGVDGHFAVAAVSPRWALACVDRVRSIPLFYARVGDGWVIDHRADRLRRAAGLGRANIDDGAALAIAMAGYTVDHATLYRGLEMLGPGECVLFAPGGGQQRKRYYAYRPWRVVDEPEEKLRSRLAQVTLAVVEKHLASLDRRPLVIPLSAGNDSRLIASAAKHLGYPDIRCFAYGRNGNFEMATSRAIAEKLGLRWTAVTCSTAGQRRNFQSRIYSDYLNYADTCASVPFVQDMTALQTLRARHFITSDAVIANGNSGDFISGNHIVRELCAIAKNLTERQRNDRVLGALLNKHFSLWSHLRTPANLASIRTSLERSLTAAGASLCAPDADHGIYEYAEFQDRQCKYVITGQRIYEFLGHEWRLPLWDNDYLDFWETVPLQLKSGQALYKAMLHEENWGGVWRNIPVNRRTLRPLWLVPLRFAAKAVHAPLGADRWHRFERRFFHYWMDPTCNSACVPYWRAAMDGRGHRLSVSWLAEQYLARHGVVLDDFARDAA